jgi:hypothetical protein
MLQNGLQRSIGFARDYLQPGAEKKIANQIVEIQGMTDQSRRKTITILGKRYKKKGGTLNVSKGVIKRKKK